MYVPTDEMLKNYAFFYSAKLHVSYDLHNIAGFYGLFPLTLRV